jgi:hypothetical protein
MSSKLDENFNPEVQDEDFKNHMYDQKIVEEIYNNAEILTKDLSNLLPDSCKTGEVQKTLDLIQEVMKVQKEDTIQNLKYVHEEYIETIKQTKDIHFICMKLDKDFETQFEKAKKDYEDEEKREDEK